MKKILLDTNIYDLVNQSYEAKALISKLISGKKIKILIPDSVKRELERSPFGGNPGFFLTEEIADPVFVLDQSRLDFARLGSGDVFDMHRGASNKTSDAIISDAAATDADVFVSEDKRCRNRLAKITHNCLVFNFNNFLNFLRNENET